MNLLGLVLLLCGTAGVVAGLRLGTFEGVMGGLVGLAGIALAAKIFLRTRSGSGRETPAAMSDARFLTLVVAWGFILRLLVAMSLHTEDRLWAYLGGDEATFHTNALCFASYVDGRYPNPLAPRFVGTREVGFFYMLGSLYYMFGIAKAIPLVVTCAIGACTAYPVHALAGRLGGHLAARRAAALVVFFPSLILWSALLVRDSVVLFLLVSALLAADHVRKRFSLAWLVALCGCLAALASLRSYIFLIASAGVVMSFAIGRRGVVKSLLTGGAVMVAVILFVQHTGVGTSHLELANLEDLSKLRNWNALGPSVAGSLGADVDISTPTAALTYLPIGMTYFLFSPLPWQIGSPRQVLAVMDLLVWYSILPAIVRGMFWMLRRHPSRLFPLLFTVMGITVLYSLVEGNIGIIFRHRAQIIVPLCAVAGVGWAVKQRALIRETTALEGPLSYDPSPGGALRPAPGLRLPAGA